MTGKIVCIASIMGFPTEVVNSTFTEPVDTCKDVCKEPAKARKIGILPPIQKKFQFVVPGVGWQCTLEFNQTLDLYECEPKPGTGTPIVPPKQ